MPYFIELFVTTFQFNDFPHLRFIEFPIYTDKPMRLDDFLAPLLSILPSSIRYIRIYLEMGKHAEIENIDWRAFTDLFMTAQTLRLTALGFVELCISNYSGGFRGAKSKTSIIEHRLMAYDALNMFVVRPVEHQDMNRGDWTVASSGLMGMFIFFVFPCYRVLTSLVFRKHLPEIS